VGFFVARIRGTDCLDVFAEGFPVVGIFAGVSSGVTPFGCLLRKVRVLFAKFFE
jgi:hypothetical protein